MTGTPAQLADTVHALVHTARHDGYLDPADAYDTVAALAAALAALPQLLHHTARWLHDQHAAGQLRADRSGTVRAAAGDTAELNRIVALTNDHLTAAGHAADCAATQLDNAAQHLAGLGSCPTGASR